MSDIEDLRSKFGMAQFHVDALNWFDRVASLRGKRVLELAGSDLPRQIVLEHFGASQWVCIDDPEGHLEIHKRNKPKLAEHYSNEHFIPAAELCEATLQRDYVVVLGDAARMSPVLNNFDVVVSIAGLEHIADLTAALRCSHDSLKEGGVLAADFGPIWSSVKGHHLDNVRDKSGELAGWGTQRCPVPPWGHLLLDENEMMSILLEHFDFETAKYSCDAIYKSPRINRYFSQDYFQIFANSKFKAFRWEKYWERNAKSRAF